MSFFPNQAIGIIGSAIPLYAELMGGSDGTNLHPLLVNTNGSLVTSLATELNNSLATWNSTTAINTTAVAISGSAEFNSVVVGLIQNSGTFNTGVITFQGSIDGTNWVSLQGVQPNGTTSMTIILSTSTYTIYQFNISGYANFRLLLSTAITGTGSVTIEFSASASVSNAAVAVTGSIVIFNMPGAITPTTSGGAGSMLYVGGLATTAAPTYGNNTSEPLSLDVAGNLRVLPYVPAAINSTGQVSVLTTATIIIAANASRKAVLITNPSTTVTIYIGTSAVTATTGSALLPGSSLTMPTTAVIYGIVASTTTTVTFLELD